VLGGTAGVPHGIANGIMLPHAMRFNADATRPELAAVARAMGLAGDSEAEAAEKAVQRVYELISQIGLPQRLRDVGVAEAGLPLLAQLALKSQAVQNNPKPVTDAAQTEAVLRAAW
jgi:alcohol dehydrogenase class IV